MCRFLLVKSKNPIKTQQLLQEFALMCQKSKTLDDDWQGDGWGTAYKYQKSNIQKQKWIVKKYLDPIWECQNEFSRFPKTKIFVVHARSASFPSQKGMVEYNQPYISDDYCFVFNGMLKGVKLGRKIKGKIGAQKIFNLLEDFLKTNNPKDSLRKAERLLLRNSKSIEGLNIGLVYKDNFYTLCQYKSRDEDYFTIRYKKSRHLTVVVSEMIGSLKFAKMNKGEIKVF